MSWFRKALGLDDPPPAAADPTMTNPVGWSSTTPPQYISNQDPNVSPAASPALMTNAQRIGLLLQHQRGPVAGADLPAAEAKANNAMETGMMLAGAVSPVKALHTTYAPFKNYDWSRLGEITAENAGGMSYEKWASNLAKIGPWASEKSLMKEMGGKVALPVEIGGNAKTFSSLDALEKAVRKAGDPVAFRQSLVKQGYGHIAVKDTEFGGRSFIALTPDNFKVTE